MNARKIVLAKFPFTDLSSSKRRSVLVIAKSKSQENDFVVAYILSVIPENLSETDQIITPLDKDYIETGLTRSSIFRMDKIATLEQSVFVGELGEISIELFEELNMKLKIVLDLVCY